MPCHAAATDAETDEGVASGLGWYSETWYCHIYCCCCCCVGMSYCSCFIIIADEVAAGRPARGPYPGLHTYRGIFESTRDEKRDRSDPTLEGLGRRDAAGIRQIERQLLGRSQDPTL
jgi:hypothetical protein